MGPTAQGQARDAMISRLGRDAEGNFSATRFIGPSGYSGISDAAKNVIFPPAHKAALDDLATVSSHFSGKVAKFANTSRTAPVIEAAGIPAAMVGAFFHPAALPEAATIAGAAYGAARYLSSPANVQKLTRFGRAQLAGATGRAALGSAGATP